jgi:hypothetical protein
MYFPMAEEALLPGEGATFQYQIENVGERERERASEISSVKLKRSVCVLLKYHKAMEKLQKD